MKKIKLFDKVNVYQNALGNTEKYVELLKDSEFNLGGKYYFSEWKDWYSIGTMMNIPMPHKNFSVVEEYPDIPHAIKQKEFIDHISNCFYTFTEDYIKEYNITLPKWAHSGISICRYDETKNTDYFALEYHTDTHEFDKESPGLKFAITCTMYLNNDYEGGEISFLNESESEVVTWKPKAGDIIIFPSGLPYFHGVHPIFKGKRYIIRLWWFLDHEGSSEWHVNKEKYGEQEWKEMESKRIKEEYDSGRHHRYVVFPGDTLPPTGHKALPFYMKNKRTV
jgi:hypothetical protein